MMELLEKAREIEAGGKRIIHMEVGEPDFPTPDLIKEKAIEAIRENRTFYTHSLGMPELREKISRNYSDSEGVDVSPDRIVVTNGTSGAFLLLFSVLVEREGIVAISDPGYPCYRNFCELFETNIAPVPVTPETHFEISAAHLEAMKTPPDLLIVTNPSNPTGVVSDEKSITGIYNHLSSRGSTLVVDEIYAGLSYTKKAKTALAISDKIVVVNGFSKTHAMTGWRLGWMVVPPHLVRPVQKVAQNVYISPPAISQYASLVAFDIEQDMINMREIYRKRRDFLLPRLKAMGFQIPVDPEGAFYIYANIERWGMDSMDFSWRALMEAGVALTPGYDFGSFRAGKHIRFTYANSVEALEEGCDRLYRWLSTL